jgi:hypothetical protein
MNFRRTVFAISLSLMPPVTAAAAEDCKPRLLHSLPLVAMRDSRMALPVMFGATQGTLIVDSAAVAAAPADAARKSVPVTGGNLEDLTAARTSYAGISGTLTRKAVETLGLSPLETGARFTGAASGRREYKVVVPEFTIHGLSPISTEFLVDDEARLATHSGTFAINNFRQFSFDLDLDFGARTAKLFSREDCAGQDLERPADWTAASVAKVSFKIDGNGYFAIPVTLDGKTVQALVDTGAVATTLDFGYASRSLGVREKDPLLKVVTQMEDGRVVYSRPFKSISFGDVTVADPTLLLVPGIRGRSEGAPTGSRVDREKRGTIPPLVLGMSALRQLRVYFAFDERLIYLAPSEVAATK